MGETHAEDLKQYLQCLADQFAYPDAAEAFGLARSSYHSLMSYYKLYDVVPPERTSGHHPTYDDPVDAGLKVEIVPLSRAARRKLKVERCVVISDLHVPFHDTRALALVLAMIEDLAPDCIIIAGDLWDAYALSRYDKDPRRGLMVDQERDAVVEVLRMIRASAGEDCEIVLVEGNHEARMRAYLISKAPHLAYLPELALPTFLKLDDLRIDFVPMKGKTAYTAYGPIKVGHFDRVNKHSAYTAKLLMDDYSCDLLQGHTHRLGLHFRTVPGEPMKVAGELGCLCQLDPEYTSDPNWQHGITVITKHVDHDRFHVSQIPIVEYKALFNDVEYAA